MINNIYYSCNEHIEYIIEDFINNCELVPNLELDLTEHINYCNYCNNHAIYVITNIN